jgi:hypothetical protein
MFAQLFERLAAAGRRVVESLRRRLLVATKPAVAAPFVGTLADLVRSKPALVLENAMLRQQLVILQRSVKRPRCTPTDRALLVLLASRLHSWRQAVLIIQPDTLLRWHRPLFRRFWRRKSGGTASAHRPPISPETVALIREMAATNRTWGAERIRGELLKLHICVAKSTIQRYMLGTRPPRRSGQTWGTFLANHGKDVWAADFLPVTDLLFRHLYAFFVIEIASRRVVHVGVTSHPTDVWVAQQLREATPSAGIRSISSSIMTASTEGSLRVLPRQRASTSYAPHSAPQRKMQFASASWAQCGGSAWITSWCLARRTCGASCSSTRPISTATDRTRGCTSGSWIRRRMVRARQGRCGPLRCWAVCITPIAEQLEHTRMDLSARTGACRRDGAG